MPSTPSASSDQLTIALDATKTLTPAQKHFNNLVKKLERQRATLQSWTEATPAFHARWQTEYLPLQAASLQLDWQLAHWLHEAPDRFKFTEVDLQTMASIICDICANLLHQPAMQSPAPEDIRTLYDDYAVTSWDEQAKQKKQQLKQDVEDMLGTELGDDVDIDDPVAFAQRVQQELDKRFEKEEAEMAERQAKAAQRSTKAQQKREAAKAKKLQEQQDAAQQANQSVQAIFRKLSSALHPDRESDPHERARKTVLMQRATAAYRDNQLWELLQLQLEVAQTDPKQLGQLADSQLSAYNRVLTQQSQALQQELEQAEAEFKMRYQIEPDARITPKDLPHLVVELLQYQQEDNDESVQLLADLQTSKNLKRWLNDSRKQQRHTAMMEKHFSQLFGDAGF